MALSGSDVSGAVSGTRHQDQYCAGNASEARLLSSIDRARVAIKQHLEGPNTDIGQIIRSVCENGWVISGKLTKVFPLLENAGLQRDIVTALRTAWEGEPD